MNMKDLPGKWTLHPDRAYGVPLKSVVDGMSPVTSLQHEHSALRGLIGVLKQGEGMPLVAVHPREADVSKPTRSLPFLEGSGHCHGHLHTAREDVEHCGLDLLGHGEDDDKGVKSVQGDAEAHNGRDEPTVGDAGNRHVPADNDSENVEQVVHPLANLVSNLRLQVHHREGDERCRDDHDEARETSCGGP